VPALPINAAKTTRPNEIKIREIDAPEIKAREIKARENKALRE
jgi:hypothetical protein